MKITISRLLEVSKYLASEVGQKIPDFFQYMGTFVEEVIRTLKNGVTLVDNMAGEIRAVSLKHDTEQIIEVKKPVTAAQVMRIVSKGETFTSFGWWYDSQGKLTVKLKFGSTPTPTDAIEVHIFFYN